MDLHCGDCKQITNIEFPFGDSKNHDRNCSIMKLKRGEVLHPIRMEKSTMANKKVNADDKVKAKAVAAKEKEKAAKAKEKEKAKAVKEKEKAAKLKEKAKAVAVKEKEKAKAVKEKEKAAKAKESKKPKSISGKFKSIRHLMETLFAKDAGIKSDFTEKEVKKEFPDSKFNKLHHGWYRHQIINLKITKNR